MGEHEISVTGDFWLGQESLNSILSVMQKTLEKAHSSVKITAYSLRYSDELFSVLRKVLSDGIPVTIVLNRYEQKEFDGVRETISNLMKKHKKFRVLNFNPESEGDLHAKIIVINHQADDCMALIGSANLSFRAMTKNHEVLVTLKGEDAETLGNLVELIAKKSTPILP